MALLVSLPTSGVIVDLNLTQHVTVPTHKDGT